MKIYHGSKTIIHEPIYRGSNVFNDYGPNFYTTDNFEDASIWACRNNTTGYVNVYEVNLKNLKILNLTDKSKYSVLHWIAILLDNREFSYSFRKLNQGRIMKITDKYHINLDDYDVIIGYRADDAYFRFPKEFISGNISLELLEKVFELGELGTQIVFHSEKAIKRLHFKKAIPADSKFVGHYFEQVQRATSIFDDLLKKSIDSNEGTRIGDLLK